MVQKYTQLHFPQNFLEQNLHFPQNFLRQILHFPQNLEIAHSIYAPFQQSPGQLSLWSEPKNL